MNPDAPAVSANGGGCGRRDRRPRGGFSRRAKNRRYRDNCRARSRLQLACWNAEGLRTKLQETSRWLSGMKVDVLAVQEAQLAGRAIAIPGYQTAAVMRRARGRRGEGPAKGGDVAIFVRDGLQFASVKESPLHPQDDSTEWCAIEIFTRTKSSSHPSSSSSSQPALTIFSMYRPPIRDSHEDERADSFDLARFPSSPRTMIMGDLNAHHPAWDVSCSDPDGVGQRVHDWLVDKEWDVLNDGSATRAGYREGRLTAPDVILAPRDMARRCTWRLGDDLGSDHLPMVVSVTVDGSLPRRVRKTRWAFGKANWPAFKADCEETLQRLPLEQPVEALSAGFAAAVMEASERWIPRGARADPKPWAADPEVEAAVEERRSARVALQTSPTEAAREQWKAAKKKAAKAEEAAKRSSFRAFASTELNRRTAIGRVHKILKKMEGSCLDQAPGQAVNGTRGRRAVEDRAKAEEFVSTYAGVSKHTRSRRRDRAVKQELRAARSRPCACGGDKTDACQPFSAQELKDQLKRMKPRKAPGPDRLCAEHLQHLGPVAQSVMLALINASWCSGCVPSSWRRAHIIPILKSGKDPQAVSSYRPISLTSHLAKLAERMVGARLSHLLDSQHAVPPEQVGFRRGRAAEDSLARLIQTVQDGWNRPKARGRPKDGVSADKFVLVAYDFSRAYDVVDHRMLLAKMLRVLPHCMSTWVFQFLRDRRARAEVNGALSSERVFRAGLPQGSVLAPTLFTLWAADLVAALRSVPRTDTFMYADDTATLSAGATIELAQARAQEAADTLAKWASQWKMKIAGQKTQLLVLSQWSRDSPVSIKVGGADVKSQQHLKLLGVTFDRLLHFGRHVADMRRKVQPRIAQLRRMTGRSWGLREQQLRTVANGYVRGAVEYAAATWFPAASESHVDVVDRVTREVARVVTGCPRSTPVAPLIAEAGLPLARLRRCVLATQMLCAALSLPPEDPLRVIAESDPPQRLATSGWRSIGGRALAAAGVADITTEERLHTTLPPWLQQEGITVCLEVDPGARRDAPDSVRRATAETLLATLPSRATWVWTDGSAEGGVTRGGGGAFITLLSGEEKELRVPAGRLCSSTRAELCALRAALEHVGGLCGDLATGPVVLCTDSQAALALLEGGAGSQRTPIGAAIWRLLLDLSRRGQQVRLQWVPAHCGLPGNERADVLAKEASALPQDEVPVDVRALTLAVSRASSKSVRMSWPDGLFRHIWRDRMLTPS